MSKTSSDECHEMVALRKQDGGIVWFCPICYYEVWIRVEFPNYRREVFEAPGNPRATHRGTQIAEDRNG